MKARYGVLIVVSLAIALALALPYLMIYSPHYEKSDMGMVSEEDFEKAHSAGGIRQGSALNPSPTMLIFPDDPYVQKIASTIKGDTDMQKASNIAKWVYRNIEYQHDIDLYGCTEYWAVPAETLYYMKGDCEDFAILFCSIAKALDLNVVLFDYNEHTSAGLYADNGNLYHCDSMRGVLSASIRYNNENPTIYDVGETRYEWFSDYMFYVSHWERSIIDIPISLMDLF